MRNKVSGFRLDETTKRQFKMAAAKAGLTEAELADRLLAPWAAAYLADQAEVPPPYHRDAAPAPQPAPVRR